MITTSSFYRFASFWALHKKLLLWFFLESVFSDFGEGVHRNYILLHCYSFFIPVIVCQIVNENLIIRSSSFLAKFQSGA